mmetsp:Transcript_8777/g.20724  ORF Transcript_8777/g.20724 Transcript_8777/m.20724 type:complete len:703 (+) Transcript_8777:89-2197(+)
MRKRQVKEDKESKGSKESKPPACLPRNSSEESLQSLRKDSTASDAELFSASQRELKAQRVSEFGFFAGVRWEFEQITHRRRFFLLFGIIAGIAMPIIFRHVMHLHGDVLDEYVQRTHLAFRLSRMQLGERIGHMGMNSLSEQGTLLFMELNQMMDFTPKKSLPQDDRPGIKLRATGSRARHPVVMIPGIITTGLELWQGEECAKSYFRQRMWGTMTMVQNVMLNTKCWLKHMALNHTTGLDQENIKLRSSQGFEAADYVVGGYWVWSKLIENLADIGYDPGLMHMAAYDWRLPSPLLEERDQFFSRLAAQTELMVQKSGEKATLVSHSMGGQVVLFFFQWVSKHRSPHWVQDNIDSFCSIATPFLGVPKGITALLSGEAKDTAEMGVLGKILDTYMSPWERRRLFRSWGSTYVMIPKGGNRLWGGHRTYGGGGLAPDFNETHHEKASLAKNMITLGDRGMTAEEAIEYLLSGQEFTDAERRDDGLISNYDRYHSHQLKEEPFKGGAGSEDSRHWSNPLHAPLPHAPGLKIFCLYGVGKETDRSYIYKQNNETKDTVANDSETPDEIGDVAWRIDTLAEGKHHTLGMVKGEGDGSVPILSAGFMCAKGWRSKHFNPGGVQTLIREYAHEPWSILYDIRGGPTTADHVDIMGNVEMIGDILSVASGGEVEPRVISEVLKLSDNVPLPEVMRDAGPAHPGSAGRS